MIEVFGDGLFHKTDEKGALADTKLVLILFYKNRLAVRYLHRVFSYLDPTLIILLLLFI